MKIFGTCSIPLISNIYDSYVFNNDTPLSTLWVTIHSEKILKYYRCIGGCLIPQNTVAEISSNVW